MSGLPQAILPPTTPLGTVQIGDEAAPVILDQRWWTFLLALLPRMPASSSLANNNSVIFKTVNGMTGDSANLAFNDITGELDVGSGLAATATLKLGGHPIQSWLPIPEFQPVSVSAAAGTVLSAAQALASALVRSGPGSAFSDSVPTAVQFTAAPYQNIIGQIAEVLYINTTAFAWTIAPSTNVIFNGNTTAGNYVIPANSQRVFKISITDGNATQHTNYYG